MNLPSKELLSKVLKIQLSELIHEYQVVCGTIYIKYDRYSMQVNIYELAHKCKEFALNYVDNIGSGYSKDNSLNRYWCICNNGDIQQYADSELEAIFQACQWILDNKDNK